MPFSVIEFQDPTGEILVARIPQEGTGEFVTGSQLMVQDGQMATFFRDGRPTDVFKAGRYTLSTQNLPVLSKVLKLGTFGLKAPFRAYVYFVQLKTFTNLGWGTPTPIMFRDSEFKAVHLRAHGVFSIRVGDLKSFLLTMVGSQGVQTTYAVEEYVRRIIVSRFANLLPSILETVLDLAAHYQEIEVKLKKAVHDDLAQYGLELVDLLVEAVTVPPEVQQMIDRAAGSRSLDTGELQRYQTVATADALRDASKQPGAKGMVDMVGAGVGLGMAQQLASGMTTGPPAQGVPPPVPGATQWHAVINGQQVGPFAVEALQQQVLSGQMTGDTLVWRQGMASWVAAKQAPELSALFAAPPSPPPPPAPPPT